MMEALEVTAPHTLLLRNNEGKETKRQQGHEVDMIVSVLQTHVREDVFYKLCCNIGLEFALINSDPCHA